ncbi:PilN domain-containing protein [Pseudomonas sp. LRF_L74]|uniref:PilN domain-containing protein n=1 Tax=Pseudomonas sp. LRF_L74 TaxID=3369422 RepID=UPI003F644E40
MQDINLYQIEDVGQYVPRGSNMLPGLAILLVVLLMYGGWLAWSLYQAGGRLSAAQAQLQADQQALVAMQASFVEPTLDAELPLRLARSEARHRELLRMVDYLDGLSRNQRAGFAAALSALAAQHPAAGLWLDGITLRNGGGEIRLRGITQSQDLLPEYLKRLGDSEVFRGREFARFDIQRGEDQLLHFDLSSRIDDKDAKP